MTGWRDKPMKKVQTHGGCKSGTGMGFMNAGLNHSKFAKK